MQNRRASAGRPSRECGGGRPTRVARWGIVRASSGDWRSGAFRGGALRSAPVHAAPLRSGHAVRALLDAFGHTPDDAMPPSRLTPPTRLCHANRSIGSPSRSPGTPACRSRATRAQRSPLWRCSPSRPRASSHPRSSWNGTARGGVASRAVVGDVVVPLRAHGGSLRAPQHARRPARKRRHP